MISWIYKLPERLAKHPNVSLLISTFCWICLTIYETSIPVGSGMKNMMMKTKKTARMINWMLVQTVEWCILNNLRKRMEKRMSGEHARVKRYRYKQQKWRSDDDLMTCGLENMYHEANT